MTSAPAGPRLSGREGTPAPVGAVPPRRATRGRRLLALVVALALLTVVVLASLALGVRDVAPPDVLDALLRRGAGGADHDVVLDQRLPRTVVGVVVGAALGLGGTVMQGITRNPLADPGLLGVNAGASLFVVLAVTLIGVTSPSGYVWFAFLGAALAAAVVYGVGAIGREGATPVKLALAGMALTAGTTSIITLLLLTDSDTLNSYRRWSVGSLAGRGTDDEERRERKQHVGALLALAMGRTLNLLAMGDDLARGLGQNVHFARAAAATSIVLLAGCATALAGPIVFVGLVVPHCIRPFTGPDYRWILPLAVLLGPVVLVAADVLGRLVVRPGEVEAGIVVAAVGAPALIAIVRRTKLVGL